ncbi:MAG TPA: 9-O-acetylesterase [Bacteroidetes bacterium]|nr:9-O-acetylesterase [Bacteroidota bacterium]
MPILKYIFLSLGIAICASTATAQLTLPKIFSDNMVLQRGAAIPVWGQANPGDKIKVYFDGEEWKTEASKSGEWEIKINPHPAGGNYELAIENQSTKGAPAVFNNLTFGDVWLCGGQSNMEFFVKKAQNAEAEIEAADLPNIRLIDVPRKVASNPLSDWEDGARWQVCSPASVPEFSAVGYFFGKNLQKEIGVPIGLVGNNWGGTVAETWMSGDAFSGLPGYQKQIEKLKNTDLEKQQKSGDEAFDNWLGKFRSQDKGINGEEYIWAKLDNYKGWEEMRLPGIWEGSGIVELKEKDGVLWYQKTISLTPAQAEKTAVLSLGTIDDSDKTWINGQLVGDTYNHYDKDRVYHIKPGVLMPGKNSIVIRVEDYIGGGGPYGDAKKMHLQLGEEIKPLAGKWKYNIGYLATAPMPNNGLGPNAYPSMLYNGMIAPMVKFPIKGVIWYQGEANAGRAYEYRDIFQRLIKDWRNKFNNNDLAFIYVQLANFTPPQDEPRDSKWAELREAQAMALKLKNTAMITAIDIGQADDIHPLNKQEVGRRLALAALHETYGKNKIIYKGPVFKNMEIKDGYIIAHFENNGSPLFAKNKYGYLMGFTISGADKKFHWAKAEITGPYTVKIWSGKIKNPAAIRYAWADNPQPANLYNEAGFPAFPFRTDNWKLSTENVKRE